VSSVEERITITRDNEKPAAVWPYRVHGKVVVVDGETKNASFLIDEDELRHLRDRASALLGHANPKVLPEKGVSVSETVLEALLDAKSMTTCEAAVKEYLSERGVVFT
jgi:hypothetical protein